jgi:hypothetical protein
MSRFDRKGKRKAYQALSTSSLPDIVFTLLFFFMVSYYAPRNDRKREFIDYPKQQKP